MAGISGYDSNSMGMLLSSLPMYRTKNSNQPLMNINLSDYSCIKNGSYYKLVKAYYSTEDKKDVSSDKKTSIGTSEDSQQTLSEIKTKSASLAETATELSSDAKLYKDREQLYDKVDEMISEYNAVLKASQKAQSDSVVQAGAKLVHYMNINASLLEEAGIEMDKSNYSMSMNRDVFFAADAGKLEKIFKGTGSISYGISVKAGMLQSQTETELKKANTYGKNGGYSSTHSTGNLLDSIL